MSEKKDKKTETKAEDKKDTLLSDAIKAIEKQYGKGSIMKLGDRAAVEIDAISSEMCIRDRITPALFAAFPTPKALASANSKEVEAKIRRIGLYRNKARSIQALRASLVEHFDGQVPQSMKAVSYTHLIYNILNGCFLIAFFAK